MYKYIYLFLIFIIETIVIFIYYRTYRNSSSNIKIHGENKLVESAIKRYLLANCYGDDLALQIDGAWGTGKTYFMKHIIFKQMVNNNYGHVYYPIYVSLNGINSILQLKNKLTNSLLLYSVNGNKRVGYEILNVLSKGLDVALDTNKKLSRLKKIGVSSKFIKHRLIHRILRTNHNSFVLVFDDLERCELNFKVVFGFISNVIDTFKCKTIIISNEQGISDDNQRNFVNKNKEKIIGKRIHFGKNSQKIALDLIDNNISGNEFVNQKWILPMSKIMMKCLKNINLRTIFSIISTYNELCRDVHPFIKDMSNKVIMQSLKTGYLSIFTLTDAVRRNKITNLKLLKRIFGYRYSDIISKADHSNNNYNNSFDDNYIYQTFFKIQDVNFENSILYTNDIYDLVTSYIFDSHRYLKEINDKFYSKNEIIRFICYKLYYDYHSISDRKIKGYEAELFKALDIYKIKFSRLLNVYSILYKMNSLGLLLEEKLNLSKMKKFIIHKAINMPVEHIDDISPMRIIGLFDSELKHELNKIYKDRYPKFLLHIGANQVRSIFRNKTYVDGPGSRNWFRKVSILEVILKSPDVQSLLFSTHFPQAIDNLNFYLNEQILKKSYKDNLKELPYIKPVKQLLNKELHKINSRVMNIDINMLLKTLDECKDHIRNKRI